ncbi:hypothetical protein J4Q44_G00290440 [Coregonus suidteri]|uniref:FIIND domain-containing protein n=1 Tax=Coregonus suidteri TaxID=861788 RepID=A0AAN8LHN8_9TELE
MNMHRWTPSEWECRDLDAKVSSLEDFSYVRGLCGSSGQLSSQEEAASEMERKPAGEESGELPSTSSGMCIMSEEECRDLEAEFSSLEDFYFHGSCSSSQEEAASEMERKPAGEESGELPSTSSGKDKKSEEDCVPLTDGAPPIIKHKETPKLEMDCPPILDIPLEMANSVNTESSPDEFTPEIHDQDNRREYQFQCLRSGLFQCSITGLVFRMEGEGEVLYRTVPWNRRLLAQSGKRPAGPLFQVDMP